MSYKKLVILLLWVAAFSVATYAQKRATLYVHVEPSEAYVFVDGQALGDGSRTLFMDPGTHTIAVMQYGFAPQIREVSVEPGKNERQTFKLERAGGPVSGPWGVLQIEGGGRAAVLLNGKTPEYIVGHGDMFNNHILWNQQLVVPAGTHQVTLTYKDGEVWSGTVTVEANQRKIVWIHKNTERAETWSDGAKPIQRPRFDAGIANTMVTVAPVTGEFNAAPGQINCGETSRLAWTAPESLHSNIADGAGNKEVAARAGEETVKPLHTTTYDFQTSGPGGVVKKDATVDVNTVVQASLTASPEDVHYLKVGDKVLVQEPANLSWNVSNAHQVSLPPVGTVGLSGSQQVTPEAPPAQVGPVDLTRSYTLSATNICGGSDSKTASVHMVGDVEPVLASIFFPTGYPDRRHPDVGLVQSQQQELERVAKIFQLYLDHTPEAKLALVGYTDVRDTDKNNMKLSERRVAAVRAFLVAQGIPADKIETEAVGKTQQLSRDEVQTLEAQNPNPAPAARKATSRTTWLAYNRRVDIKVKPVDAQSAAIYPHTAPDAKVLWQAPWPGLRTVQRAQ